MERNRKGCNPLIETLAVIFVLGLTAWGLYEFTTGIVEVATAPPSPESIYYDQEIQRHGPGH